jgi:glucose/arabinose dehydrogenase
MKTKLPRFFFLSALLLLLLAFLPGDLSPLSLAQRLANTLAPDGGFGALDLALYQRLQKAALAGGLCLLAAGGLLAYAARAGKTRLARAVTLALYGAGALALLLAASLLNGRSRAFVYRQMGIVVPAPVPSATAAPSPTPVPTPVTHGPGNWQIVAEGLQPLTAIAEPGDGSGRLFLLETNGLIRVLHEGVLSPEPFLDLRDRVVQRPENFEQGLLGLAFSPHFSVDGYFIVSYIDYQENSVLSRFRVTPGGVRGDPASEFRLLGILQPGARHNGGTLVFGPDGYLYLGLGDGDLRQKTRGHAQSLDELFGKILRIAPNLNGDGDPYTIPPDNPFVGAYGRDEIYLSGFRNPWKLAFDPLTGDLYIGDVGQNDWEEVNFLGAGQPAGGNYGWDILEGNEPFSGYRGAPPAPGAVFIPPLHVYHHKPFHCAITGGVVYRGAQFPGLQGMYLFGDFCSGYIWGLTHTADGVKVRLLWDTAALITAFGVDAAGELYLADYQGILYRLVP